MSGIDLSFVSGKEKFNYRVCAVILSEGKLLAMHDERSPYYYLPGGRVQMGETAEDAVVREVQEELAVTPEIIRPLWLNQAFFTEDVDGLHYHELCLYFLMDISHTDLLSKGEKFTLLERHHTHKFEWLPFERLEREYFYPLFLKRKFSTCQKPSPSARNWNKRKTPCPLFSGQGICFWRIISSPVRRFRRPR